MLPATTDVLVIGAGPVGLVTGIVLTQLGHEVTVVDDQPDGAHTSRAAVVHARTMEVLQPYGLTERLRARGVHVPQFSIRDRDRVLVRVPFDGLPTPFPYTLMVSQADTEQFLGERLAELGGKVLRPLSFTALEQDDAGVTATFSDGQRVRAAYLVGADGMHSAVREASGIAFAGSAYEESFSLADVHLSGGVPLDEVILYFSPEGMVVVAPLPDGVHRIVATVDEAPERPDVAFVQQLLGARGPQALPAVVEDVVWGSRFHVHHRIARSFRDRRVLLAGDAAHVHSPAGGQGMNLGIEDAVQLGEALSCVLRGESPRLLDTYAATRRPAAERVVALADRLTRLATVGASRRPMRNLLLGTLGRLPAFQHRLAWRLAGLDRRTA